MSRIVVVEDDPIFRNLLTDVLKNLGHEVFAEADAESLELARFQDLKPRLVVIDLGLPGIPGDQLCSRLAVSGHRSGAKFLLTSNVDEKVLASRAKSTSADGFVTKRQLLKDPAAALKPLLGDSTKATEPGEVKRDHARVEVRAECNLTTSIALRGGTSSVPARLTNLSISGLAVTAIPGYALALAVNEPVTMTFELGRGGPIYARARVAWVHRTAAGLVERAGLEFDALDRLVRARIQTFVAQILALGINRTLH